MSAYTIYKDACGKIYALWDRMTDNGDWPMTCKGPMTPLAHGEAQGLRELAEIQKTAQEQYEAQEEQLAPEWMTPGQKRDFWEACRLIDTIQSPRDFYRVMDALDRFSVDVIQAARYEKRCYNSAQYA